MSRKLLPAALIALLALPAGAQAAAPIKTGHVATVMTRNLYLGADLSPAIGTSTLPQLIVANGKILRQVTATNFPVRAKGLAAEIESVQPDLVGLQEVALWRTRGLTDPAPATTVRYDFLQLLLDQLNAGGETYRAVVVQPEFDFEAPADEGGNLLPDIFGRLTMRDVILQRVDNSSVKIANPQKGHFTHLLLLPIVGQAVPVTRGWTSVDAKVRGGGWFHFVNTHFEAFDPRVVVPSIRAQQASELLAGPLGSNLPVVLVGDLNSDDDTVVPGDQQAYRVLLNGGFSERSTNDPLSCCVDSYDLTTGSADEFDHQVDHVMTDTDRVKLVDSGVTGRTMNNGYWDSDHAGVWSALQMR